MEVWTQNSIELPADRVAIVKTVLREIFLTTFETAIAEGKKDTAGDAVELPHKAMNTALGRISMTVPFH